MSARRLVLVRHGRTASNAAGVWQGQLDVPLDDVGVGQAERAARVLAGLPPARVVASDLSRAVQTARAVATASGLPVSTDPGLREVWAGQWEGLRGEEIAARWPADRAAWSAGRDVRLGGGETRSEASARVVEVLRRELEATDGGTLVVVGHGGSLRGGMLELLGVPGEQAHWLGRMLNAHWAVLAPRGDRWVLQHWNVGAPDPAAPDGADSGVD